MEKSLTLDWGTDELHEECGVFGMYDLDGNDVASTIYYGLFALQHRGQESCGIAVSDTYGPKGVVNACKGMGLCNEVFTSEKLEKLKGNIGVGHVRYSTGRLHRIHSRSFDALKERHWHWRALSMRGTARNSLTTGRCQTDRL